MAFFKDLLEFAAWEKVWCYTCDRYGDNCGWPGLGCIIQITGRAMMGLEMPEWEKVPNALMPDQKVQCTKWIETNRAGGAS